MYMENPNLVSLRECNCGRSTEVRNALQFAFTCLVTSPGPSIDMLSSSIGPKLFITERPLSLVTKYRLPLHNVFSFVWFA